MKTLTITDIGWIHEFTATNITLKSEQKYKTISNMKANKDLFEVEVFYDRDFWDAYNLPTESKFLERIQNNLEAAANGKSLAQQFEDVGVENNKGRFKKEKKRKKGAKGKK